MAECEVLHAVLFALLLGRVHLEESIPAGQRSCVGEYVIPTPLVDESPAVSAPPWTARRYTRCLPGGRVVVEAESVLLSEAVAAALRNCSGPPQFLEVYATKTVVVDDSVRLPGAALAVVAPRWEIPGSPTIDLDGLDGEAPGEAPPRSAVNGQRGRDGQPGQPGHPGGMFMGVGLEFTGNKVRVSARGGAGGAGQDGGAGGMGGFGIDGGDGGRAGEGGPGGRRGKAGLVDLGDHGRGVASEHFLLDVSDGATGSAGRGGPGGDYWPQRGVMRPLRRPKRDSYFLAYLYLMFLKRHGQAVSLSMSARARSGAPGAEGAANTGQRDAERVLDPALADAWNSIPARTATYFERNKNHPHLKREVKDFLRFVRGSPDLQSCRFTYWA